MDAVAAAIEARVDALVRERFDNLAARLRAELARDDEGERLYSVTAAAERLSESETSTRRRIADGSLPHVLVPGRVSGAFEMRVRGADL